MSMIKKITKHGNSYALVLDKSVLDLIGIDQTTVLEVSTPDGKSLLITPVEGDQKFKKTLKKINKKYHPALKKLAE